MSLQRSQGAFRSNAQYLSVGKAGTTNAFDPIFAVPTNPGWTAGTTMIDGLSLTPPANQAWTLQQLSVSAVLLMEIFTGGGPIYGKFGKILAGLATMVSPTSANPAIANLTCNSGVQLPADRTAIGTLWDPATDPLPPNVLASPVTLPLSLTITPPQPIPINQGETIGIGLWMLPSLLGQIAPVNGWELILASATWAIIYDDGVTPPNYA